jgi:hypothetical protein
MEAWFGFIGAISGVIVTWGLTQATKIITASRKAARDLSVAAFVCLDRLYKIQKANKHGDKEQEDHEIFLLGSDLDRYRDCIAASPKMRGRHYYFYRRMMPILLQHDLSNLKRIITALSWFLRQGKRN